MPTMAKHPDSSNQAGQSSSTSTCNLQQYNCINKYYYFNDFVIPVLAPWLKQDSQLIVMIGSASEKGLPKEVITTTLL